MSLLGPARPPFPLDICISNYYGIIVSPGTYNYHPSAELHCAIILANLRTTLPDLTRRIHCFWMGKYDQVSAHHPRLRGSPAGLVGLAKWVQRGFRLARELDRFLGRCPELLGGGEFFCRFFSFVLFILFLVLIFILFILLIYSFNSFFSIFSFTLLILQFFQFLLPSPQFHYYLLPHTDSVQWNTRSTTRYQHSTIQHYGCVGRGMLGQRRGFRSRRWSTRRYISQLIWMRGVGFMRRS